MRLHSIGRRGRYVSGVFTLNKWEGQGCVTLRFSDIQPQQHLLTVVSLLPAQTASLPAHVSGPLDHRTPVTEGSSGGSHHPPPVEH